MLDLRRIGVTSVLLAVVGTIGIADVASGPDYGMSLFYLVPIGLAAWRLGLIPGAVLAVAAAGWWTTADLITESVPTTASLWNGFTRLVIFSAMVYMLDRVRAERDQRAELSILREQLLYSVAHELRNPLSVLENVLDIIGEEYTELSAEEFERLVLSARRTAGRLRTLMEDLLSAGAIRSGHFRVDPRPIALRAIVREAADLLETLVAERGQTIEIVIPEDLVVLADARYARQVLTNLLTNACNYGPQASTIRIAAEAVDGHVRVAVIDRGLGISKEKQMHLFERYYRTRSEGPGIGLGLAISKGIVEAHGGNIGLESEPGRGTTVWFTLPLGTAAA